LKSRCAQHLTCQKCAAIVQLMPDRHGSAAAVVIAAERSVAKYCMQSYPEYCRAKLEEGNIKLNCAAADLNAARGKVCLNSASFLSLHDVHLRCNLCRWTVKQGTITAAEHLTTVAGWISQDCALSCVDGKFSFFGILIQAVCVGSCHLECFSTGMHGCPSMLKEYQSSRKCMFG
jgi:hypothetical protein